MKSLDHMIRPPEGGALHVDGECEEHGKFTVDALWFGGDLKNAEPECPVCVKSEEVENERREKDELAERRKAKTEQKMRDAGIPSRYLEAGKFNPPTENAVLVYRAMRDYLENLDESLRLGSSLILTGKPGTGKTHLACKLGIEVMSRGHSVKYTTAAKAVRHVRSSFSKNTEFSEQEAINSLSKEIDFLIIDEVGLKVSTKYDRQVLAEIVDDRSSEKRPTVIISNLPIDELEEVTDDRMIERLRDDKGTLLIFDWESHRGRAS